MTDPIYIAQWTSTCHHAPISRIEMYMCHSSQFGRFRTYIKPRLFLHEQLAHLHTGNTQTKLQTQRPMKKL